MALERLAKERGTLPVCSEYLQAMMELVYMLMIRAKNNDDTNNSNETFVSIADNNNINDNKIAEKSQSSSSSSSPLPSSEPPLLGVGQGQQQMAGQETSGPAPGHGLDPSTPRGVPQLEGTPWCGVETPTNII